MKHSLVTLALAAAVSAVAVPLTRRETTTTLLFNAPAWEEGGNTHASFEAFVHFAPKTGVLEKALNLVLKPLGITTKLDTALDRMKLFGDLGRPEEKVKVSVAGCSDKSVDLSRTSLKDTGVALTTVSLGTCEGTGKLTATPDHSPPATVFRSPATGLGVISDIDDTIKITDVLNDKTMAENTLFNDPLPVPGMPDLYASLATSLTSNAIPPQFFYVSGSPMQLYPFINDFLQKTYTKSYGPIFLQNFSLLDLSLDLKMLKGGETQTYKEAQITRIHGMYPQKSFLAIGDSTQKDPEVYADMYRRFPGFIRCIWIHEFDGADNSADRFAKAFKDIPEDKYRLYKTADIESLKGIKVAEGHCK